MARQEWQARLGLAAARAACCCMGCGVHACRGWLQSLRPPTTCTLLSLWLCHFTFPCYVAGSWCRCLEKAAEAHADEFSERCKEELSLFEVKAATDYRLSSRLASACKEAVEQSCPNLCGINARE